MPNPGNVLTLAPPNGEITLLRASAVAACAVGAYSPCGQVAADNATNEATIAPVEMSWRAGDAPAMFFAPPTTLARTWRGRRVHTEEDMLQMDCPYPPDPDL